MSHNLYNHFHTHSALLLVFKCVFKMYFFLNFDGIHIIDYVLIFYKLKNENRFVKTFAVKIYNPNSPQDDKWEDYQEPYGTTKV